MKYPTRKYKNCIKVLNNFRKTIKLNGTTDFEIIKNPFRSKSSYNNYTKLMHHLRSTTNKIIIGQLISYISLETYSGKCDITTFEIKKSIRE